MATFQFEVDGINLPADAVKRIETGIQSLVLHEIAAIVPASKNENAATTGGFEFHVPKGWYGGRIIPVAER